MMSLASMPGGGSAAPPAPGNPQMPQANAPAMPPPIPGLALPAVPQPAAPQFSMPQPPPPVQAPSTNILLMAIVGLLGFLAGGLVVFLLMRR